MQNRKLLIQKIHIAKNQLNIDDETYRLMLFTATGKRSCSEMNISELSHVFYAMKKRGFRAKNIPNIQKKRTGADEKLIYINKVTALLTELKLPTTYADSVAKQAFKVDCYNWLDVLQLKKLIQMLSVYHYRKQREKSNQDPTL
ncbi:GemA protein [Mergibacter septicus]|uniref:gp16 family protein n=1 Tax=Mergibacter septicus TaxID=221402 RepID=UPI00117908DC|nr:regulatory protein GemA [Mergibacter septicus]AWX14251.1 GemA protein [Mergibacter septicus]